MTNMLTPEMARMALAFLDRSSMQGAEVQAFLRVQVALQAIASPPEVEKPPTLPQDLGGFTS